MKQITFIAALLVAFSMNAQIFEESFEDFDDFAIANIGDWTLIDNDGFPTFASNATNFENEAYTGSAIIFNHTTALVDGTGMPASSNPEFQVRTGEKGLWFFAATTAPNDDYAITPQISLSNVTGASFSFFAKSITDNFGLEQFEVLLSTTGTNIADFTENLSGGIITAPTSETDQGDPGNVYTEFSFDLTEFEGQDIFLAIHYVGNDSFILQMDDFVVDGTLSVNEFSERGFKFSVFNGEMRLSANEPLQNVSIYNLLGQNVLNQKLSETNEVISLNTLATGVYVAQATIAGTIESFKIIKR